MLEKIGIILGAITVVVLIALIIAWPVQLLWNGCLVGAIDGIHQIKFMQALGISILFSLLFKNSSTK